jgi:hypothetical protein
MPAAHLTASEIKAKIERMMIRHRYRCDDDELEAVHEAIHKAGAQYELLAKNSINEPVFGSNAVSDGELFLRSHKALWCISETKRSR